MRFGLACAIACVTHQRLLMNSAHDECWLQMKFSTNVILNREAVQIDALENADAVENTDAVKSYVTVKKGGSAATRETGKREKKMTSKGILYLLDILQKTWKSKLTQVNKVKQKVDMLLSLKITTETLSKKIF